MVQLETTDKLEQTFANPFRRRAPWALDSYRRPVAVSSALGKHGCDDLAGDAKQGDPR